MPADRISRLEEETVNFSNVDNENTLRKEKKTRSARTRLFMAAIFKGLPDV